MRWPEPPHASGEPAAPRPPEARPGRFVLLPPPNVTGDLHLGHGFSFTLLDTYVRYFRSRGEVVHFFPGTEHAGSRAEIAYKRQHGGQWDMAAFQRWQQETRQSIVRQIACIGVDADWHAEYNSMDRERVRFMRQAFVKLHGDGYIYPSTEMVNWCPCCRTSISEIDVKSSVQRVPGCLCPMPMPGWPSPSPLTAWSGCWAPPRCGSCRRIPGSTNWSAARSVCWDAVCASRRAANIRTSTAVT